METLFNILYFLVTSDSTYDNQEYNAFINENALIYSLLTIVLVGILLSFLYYLILNKSWVFNKIGHWLFFTLLVGIIGGCIIYSIVGSLVYPCSSSECPPIESAGWVFIIMSAVYSMLVFYLFSLMIKRYSTMAKFTPHIWPQKVKRK